VREAVDTAVFDFFERLGLDKNATRREIERNLERRRGDAANARKRAERDLETAEKRMARVRTDYKDGHLTAAEWRKLEAELEDERNAAMESVRARVEAERSLPNTALADAEQAVMTGLTRVRDAIAGGGQTQRVRAALEQLYEAFIVTPASDQDEASKVLAEGDNYAQSGNLSFTRFLAPMRLSTPALNGTPSPSKS